MDSIPQARTTRHQFVVFYGDDLSRMYNLQVTTEFTYYLFDVQRINSSIIIQVV